MGDTMPSEWPSRFIYVCNAGRAALVNALPPIHAGLHRVARMVVFCGAMGPEETDQTDRAEAIVPALRLSRAIARWTDGRISEAQGTLTVLYGWPTSVADWRRNMRLVLNGPDAGLPVLYNFKGGTKEMAIGGTTVLAAEAADRGLSITVSDQLPRVELVTGDEQVPLPVAGGHLDLPCYLELYGFRAHIDSAPDRAHQQRAAIEAFCIAERERITAFAARFLPRAVDLWPILERLTRRAEDAPPITEFIDLPTPDTSGLARKTCDALAGALGVLHGFPGLEIERNAAEQCTRFRIADAVAERFLRSGWLEDAVYLALRQALGDRNDVTVAAGLGLAPSETPATRETEIDVAILIGSQLLIVEAKSSAMTGRAAKQINERSLPMVEGNMRALLGQVGKALIVNPCVTAASLRRQGGAVIQRSRRGGLDLFVGPTAIDDLVKYVKALAGGDTPPGPPP